MTNPNLQPQELWGHARSPHGLNSAVTPRKAPQPRPQSMPYGTGPGQSGTPWGSPSAYQPNERRDYVVDDYRPDWWGSDDPPKPGLPPLDDTEFDEMAPPPIYPNQIPGQYTQPGAGAGAYFGATSGENLADFINKFDDFARKDFAAGGYQLTPQGGGKPGLHPQVGGGKPVTFGGAKPRGWERSAAGRREQRRQQREEESALKYKDADFR